MARFNVTVATERHVKNLAGGLAYQISPKAELATLLLTSFVKAQFYRSEEQQLDRTKDLIGKAGHEFAAKAAVYARDRFNMRTISHVVAGELAINTHKQPWMRRFIRTVVVRPDDMTEMVAYWNAAKGRTAPLPKAFLRGLADAFGKFDGYQLAKNREEGHAVKLVDIVNLAHPKPTDKNREALAALVKGTLRSSETWEAKLTEAGQSAETPEDKAEKKAEAWAELIQTGKISYMALVMNLRNILEQAPEAVQGACQLLTDAHRIERSRLLPFRFVTAKEEIAKLSNEKAALVIQALSDAAETAVKNVPALPGRTLVAVDASGSMMSSGNEGRAPIRTAALFAAALVRRSDADMLFFANDGRYYTVDHTAPFLTIQEQIEKTAEAISGGTNFHAIFTTANKSYDRIIVLTDSQGWIGGGAPDATFAAWKQEHKARPKMFVMDLAGNGTLQFPEEDVFLVAGFSERVFEVMALLEQDREALVKQIEAVVFA